MEATTPGIQENLLSGLAEKDVALDIALRLSYDLEDAGLKCVLTRRDDTFITLENRVAIANAQPDSIFVSIHLNAAPNREARGIETYFPTSAAGSDLAKRIQEKLAGITSGDNRGAKAGNFVLRKNKDRAVLVECGFLTNPEDIALAKDDDFRQNTADQICAAIVQYRNSLR